MRDGVIASLFKGRIDDELLRVAPPEDDPELLELLFSSLDRFLERKVDPARIDREGTLPPEVIEGMKELGPLFMFCPQRRES